MRHPFDCECNQCQRISDFLMNRLPKASKNEELVDLREQIRWEVGDIVIWDFYRVKKIAKLVLFTGPLRIESLEGRNATIVGPIWTCFGKIKAVVPTKELMPY